MSSKEILEKKMKETYGEGFFGRILGETFWDKILDKSSHKF